jgi:N-acetylneuraminic acid mutarotase
MHPNYRRAHIAAACGLAVCASASTARAHFLWLKKIEHEGKPHAFLFFGENPADEAYHLPERLAKTEVWRRTPHGKRAKLDTIGLDTDDRVGLISPAPDDGDILEATQQYGIYGATLLVYYAKHIGAKTPQQLNSAGPSKELKLDICVRRNTDELQIVVLWDGKPLPGAKVSVAVEDAEAVEKTTDNDGRLTIKPEGDGIVGVLANHLDKEHSGQLDGKDYKGCLHYASLTMNWADSADADERATPADKSQAGIPPLPEPVSSFGAAVADGWLYVYGGHIGAEHEHSAANLSKSFRRVRIDGSGDWEVLPMQTPLQGLALVAHGGKVYRVGGLNARNRTKADKEDLHSTAEFAQFDPASDKWSALTPLPTPRSSHNAVVIGKRLYVVGGWQLTGRSPGEWQPQALGYDFTQPERGWQELPNPPFKRRALAIGAWQGKLVAIGGMNAEGKVSQRVDLFDPTTDQWSRGPELPGAGLAGFGGSACELDGELYASGLRGIVYRLSDSGSAWEEVARLDKPRFFHQLLPASDGRLVAVGGASRKGHLADVEFIDVSNKPAGATISAAIR